MSKYSKGHSLYRASLVVDKLRDIDIMDDAIAAIEDRQGGMFRLHSVIDEALGPPVPVMRRRRPTVQLAENPDPDNVIDAGQVPDSSVTPTQLVMEWVDALSTNTADALSSFDLAALADLLQAWRAGDEFSMERHLTSVHAFKAPVVGDE